MPARLQEEGDLLILKLGGDDAEFQHQKAAAKTIPGYRYDPKLKAWCYRNDQETLIALANRVEPDMPKTLEAKVQAAAAEQAEQLVTTLPDDAAVAVPWRDRLAPKQRAGIDFMAEHPHAILADEMGAGKTAEAISTVHEVRCRCECHGEGVVDVNNKGSVETHACPNEHNQNGPRVLVICLNAATGHWQREIEKWAGEESTVITGGPEDRAAELAASKNWTIINWEKLALMVDDLKKVKWDAVLADEAHAAKNPKSKRSKALCKIQAPIQIAMSGTPVMNNPGELFPLLKWLRPEQYTSYWAFFYNFTEYYEGARKRKIVTGVKNPDALRFELADKLVRRTKREIHPEIPVPFDPIIYEPEMKEEQVKLYKAALKEFWLEVAQEVKPEDREELAQVVETGDLNVLRLMIPNAAARTVRLRQIATSPALLGGPDVSGKMEEIERLVREGGDRPWVWFAWYRDTVDLLVRRFREMGFDAHGFKGNEGERPDELAQAFQAGEFPIICATIKSGGQSIELQTAADCGFAEEEYVPGINQQAFDRIDRMGQTQRPQRHIIRTPGTVETGKIAPAQGTKKLIVTTILGGS
jgi:SNF2 family DNA or RNA helicase